SDLVAKNGGNGSAGTPGETGLAPTAGAPGANVWCTGHCKSVNTGGLNCQCQQPDGTNLQGGAAGSAGGHGGAGKKGGGGSGGATFAAVTIGGASVTLESGQQSYGQPGMGADGAPAGDSGNKLTVP